MSRFRSTKYNEKVKIKRTSKGSSIANRTPGVRWESRPARPSPTYTNRRPGGVQQLPPQQYMRPPSLGLGGSGYQALVNAAINECPFLNTVDYGGWNSYESILNTLNRCDSGPAVNSLRNTLITDPNPYGWAETCCFVVSVVDAITSLFGGTNCCDVANTQAGGGQDQGGGGNNQGGGNQGGQGGQGGSSSPGGSDIALKENINLVGESPSGINIYEFDYKNKQYGEGRYRGVMAQEVPEASFRNTDGYLWVDYSKVDVDFEKIEESNE